MAHATHTAARETETESKMKTEFEGVRTNPDLSINSHEHIIAGLRRERVEILAELLKNDWIEAGGLTGYYSLKLKLDAVVYDEAAIAYSIGRDYRVKYVRPDEDGKLLIEIEILEWESDLR